MNDLQQAAFLLNLGDVVRLAVGGKDVNGALLAACSAHDPSPDLQVRVIRHLVTCGASANETEKNGVTPLHRAVRFRSVAAVRELIAQGANVNAVDRRTKSTPLHRAVTTTGAPSTAGKLEDALEIARLLLTGGADPRTKNRNGKTPADYVKSSEMIALLREYDRL